MRLTKPQKLRLQHLMRPGYSDGGVENPTRTDTVLASKGLVSIITMAGRGGMSPRFRTVITEAGRLAVPEDGYEYCAMCACITPRDEAACLQCGASKEWAA
jgi:hypothetical protein